MILPDTATYVIAIMWTMYGEPIGSQTRPYPDTFPTMQACLQELPRFEKIAGRVYRQEHIVRCVKL